MDPIAQLTQKLLVESARQPIQRQQQQPTPDTAPPPYEDDSDSESDDVDSTTQSSPLKVTINAAHQIQGNNNLVPTSPTALADAAKFSTILLHSLNAINNAAGQGAQQRRPVKLDLTINCGITVVGDRNVVGNVGLKQKSPMAVVGAGEAANAVAGAKRKAEEVC